MTHIDLFSGIGGFALAAQWAGFNTIAFVEIEPYAQEIIRQRFGAVSFADAERRDGRQDNERQTQTERGRIEETCLVADAESGRKERESRSNYPAWSCTERRSPTLFGDIREFDGRQFRGATLLTGGFPCQPFSQAGKRGGAADDRALWPEMFRVIREARPTWVLGENVAGIVTMELDNVLSDLEREGYSVQPLIIPACAVDARHRRDRVWIVGHADSAGRGERRRAEPVSTELLAAQCGSEAMADAPRHEQGRQEQRPERQRVGVCGESESLADAEGRTVGAGLCEGEQTGERGRRSSYCRWEDEREWLPEPDVGRVANGIPARVDRLKGLGNSIVPPVAYEILRVIAEIESATPSGMP